MAILQVLTDWHVCFLPSSSFNFACKFFFKCVSWPFHITSVSPGCGITFNPTAWASSTITLRLNIRASVSCFIFSSDNPLASDHGLDCCNELMWDNQSINQSGCGIDRPILSRTVAPFHSFLLPNETIWTRMLRFFFYPGTFYTFSSVTDGLFRDRRVCFLPSSCFIPFYLWCPRHVRTVFSTWSYRDS